MKTTILSLSDSNMAGFSWSWNFYLEDRKKGAYELSCEQVTTDGDAAVMIDPVSGLRSGADVYVALDSMLSEAGYSLAEDELASIGAKIAKLNRRLAEQFERGHEPTYTWEEEQAFYRAIGDGPKIVLHAPRPVPEAPKTAVSKIAASTAGKIATQADALNLWRDGTEEPGPGRGSSAVNPGGGGVGIGPILGIGENDKAATMYRPPNRSNNDATFIVLQERDDFCGVRVVPIGKMLNAGWPLVGNVALPNFRYLVNSRRHLLNSILCPLGIPGGSIAWTSNSTVITASVA